MAILPIFSKVLKRVIFNQIIRYVGDDQLLHHNHHAYDEAQPQEMKVLTPKSLTNGQSDIAYAQKHA